MRKQTNGEFLADVAAQVAGSRIQLCEAGHDPDTALAVVKLALFLKARPGVQFCAIYEGWDRARIIRELY